MKTDAFDAEELTLIKLAKEYSDEDKARELLELLRWKNDAQCPHCQALEPYKLKGKEGSKRPCRKGLYKCRACRRQFTVTVGTVFEDSHIPIATWLQAIFIMCSAKKGISAHQLHRMLGITYKSAWFMCHRIRFSMTESPLAEMLKGTVECDETYVGGKPRYNDRRDGHKGGYRRDSKKVPVVALIERNGKVRTKVVASVSNKNLEQFVDKSICKTSVVNTDQFGMYRTLFYDWKRHDVVNHSQKEYARRNPDKTVSHVNTCESFFSLLKRGVFGSFHHVSKEHLPKYCDEFAFRWNTRKMSDGERMAHSIGFVTGKRLTYKQAI